MLLLTRPALHAHEAAEARESVHRVDHVVPGSQLEERLDRPHLVARTLGGAPAGPEDALHLVVVEQHEAPAGHAEALAHEAQGELDALGTALLLQGLRQVVPVGLAVARHEDAGVRGRLAEGLGRAAHADLEGLHAARLEDQVLPREALEAELLQDLAAVGEPLEGTLVGGGADPQGLRALLDAERLHGHPQGVRGEQLARVRGPGLADLHGVRGEADRHLVVGRRRPLIGRVEGPQGLHLVLEQLDPQGFGGGERIEVEDVAAQAHLPGGLGQRLALVPHAHQAIEQALPVEDLPLLDGEDLALEVLERGQGLEQRDHARHDDARPLLDGPGHAPRQLHAGEGRAAVGALAGREGQGLHPELGEVGREGLRLTVGGEHDQGRAVPEVTAGGEVGEDQRLRAAPEPARVHPTRTARDEVRERGALRELRQSTRIQEDGGGGLGCARGGHAGSSSSPSSASRARSAARRSASFKVEPQASGWGVPATTARTRKRGAWASPDSSSSS